MLRIHFSNRLEALTRLLLARLVAGGAGVFTPDCVIVPSAALRRALTLSIADAQGICAQVRFEFLAEWLWRQIARAVPGVAAESPLAADTLAWRIYAAFGDRGFVAAFARLDAFLSQADDAMRLDLAQGVAALFEQYVTYRPDWLETWAAGGSIGRASGAVAENDDERWQAADDGDERWQAALWRRLAAELGLAGEAPARRFVDALREGGGAGLPARVHVFALPAIAPLHLRLLEQMAHVSEVDVYVLNPCREYWFELVDRRRLGWLAARGRAAGHEEGQRLLAAWGGQTQAFVDSLLDAGAEAVVDDGHFEPAPAPTLLARLQNSILDLEEPAPGSLVLDAGDRSLELHVCHSRVREVEVLQDHLLGLFAADSALRPADIVVVMPDLDGAAPLVEAVFGTAPADRRIPYAITGLARSVASAPARALLGLLALASSRVAASTLYGWLQQPVAARRFGLDEAGLERLHGWIVDAGFRWGIDAAQRARLALPPSARHTLADATERLFLGYAMPTIAEEPFGDLLPAGDAEGSAANTLGAFWRFGDALARLQAELAQPRPPADWERLLLEATETFIEAEGDEVEDLRELQHSIRDLVRSMAQGGIGTPLPLAVLRRALEQALDAGARGGIPSGAVTFASMSSLRGLPYEVVCAIGLDDGAFPSTRRVLEFDLLAVHPRRGDRQRRLDERNLFLDLLLSARCSVYLSHTGRSVRDNSPLPPSVLVSELLDWLLDGVAGCDAEARARARRRLVVEHPLQPFSIEAFSPGADPRLRSHRRELAQALRQAREAALAPPPPAPEDEEDGADEGTGPAAAQPRFFTAALPPPAASWCDATLRQLDEFFRNPCRYLLRRRMGIELPRAVDELQDEEPFVPDWLAAQGFAQRLLPALLAGAGADLRRGLAAAGVEMPEGAIGDLAVRRELLALEGFAARVRAAAAPACLPPCTLDVSVEIEGEPWRLQAAFADLRPAGLLRWRFDQARAADLLGAWLHHLALCALAPAGVEPRTHWLMAGGEIGFEPVVRARESLADLLRLYRRGLSEPLHFFPKSAWAFVRADGNPVAARKVWQPSAERPFAEGADPAYRLALRGAADPLDAEFETLARAVFDPLLAHLADGATLP